MTFSVRAMTPEDAGPVLAIYQLGIDEGDATFETTAPTWAEFTESRLPEFSQVAVDPDGTVLGWIAATRVSSRACYAGVIEHSVYVHPDGRGRGVGRRLLDRLIELADEAGVWTIQSSIFPENQASLALHAAVGFRVVGTRIKIAQQHGRWRDTVLIERRSPGAGEDDPAVL
ncbi:GNAT family N-acetyltransferase [Microlunatus parietis]|uniref:Phosphinothricin acetyltransferase n=1 Tax=Microlunatus parietis TaxID=682979 RepID=A0A7Y9IFA8_9ACTN|nr:GNAT family N-acetyltransferase [Microlunatus parietis]NYE75667.1 phosphinothricin acetyltransferase [Microlunatus parietis]